MHVQTQNFNFLLSDTPASSDWWEFLARRAGSISSQPVMRMHLWIIHSTCTSTVSSSHACLYTDGWRIKGKTWMLGPHSEGIPWLYYAVGGILLVLFGSICPLRVKAHCKSIRCCSEYPMMKRFYPDGSGLFQNDNAPIHRARGVTEWFDMNHTLWPSQLPDFNPTEHLWEILDWHVRQRSPPPSSKHQMRDYLLEEWCSSVQ